MTPPPPLELFQKFIRFGRAIRPLKKTLWPQKNWQGGLHTVFHLGHPCLNSLRLFSGQKCVIRITRETLDDLMKNFVETAKAGTHGEQVRPFLNKHHQHHHHHHHHHQQHQHHHHHYYFQEQNFFNSFSFWGLAKFHLCCVKDWLECT